MIKAKQFRSILFLMLKLGVFAVLSFILFEKINGFPNGFQPPSNINIGLVILFLSLMPLNWFIEWLKWKTIVASKNISLRVRWHSFLSGMVSGVITPAYAGNFIGRMFYFNKKDRKEVILNTLVSNGAQFIISIVMGLIAFTILYSNTGSSIEILVGVFILTSSFGLYFFGDKLLSKIPFKIFKELDLVLVSKTFRAKLLGLSLLRYLTFIVQFFIALIAFEALFDLTYFLWIALMFGAVTAAPSLLLGKIIVRETIALSVLSMGGIAGSVILLAAFSTWMINQILPVIIATLLLKKERIHALV